MRRLSLELKQVPAAERHNPQVIRALLHEWISAEFDGFVDPAAAAVEQQRPAPGEKGHFGIELKPETLYRLVLDDTYAKYAHLEAVAHYHRVPVSMLLFFTRVKAELEEVETGGHDRARKIVDACRAFIGVVESLVGLRLDEQRKVASERVTLDFEDFKKAADEYASVFAGERLNF
jgi:hypothetical protein